WPDLQFVLVTDHPPEGRSCFQAIIVNGGRPLPFEAVDLVKVPELDFFAHNIADHEELLGRIFATLTRT
ncbi:MAG TPA: hypothetical protein VFX28_18210, partial [Methylomirabilota bacterium]|nr:hypothetical protein [Methylomirabilota bacterium]